MKQYLTKSSESQPPSKKNRVFGPPGPDITQDTDSQPMQPVLLSYPQIDGPKFQAACRGGAVWGLWGSINPQEFF